MGGFKQTFVQGGLMVQTLAILLALLLTFWCCVAQAGTVEQAVIVADPQMQVKNGALDGCGFRLKSMAQSASLSPATVVLDTSFNLYSSGLALVKGGAVQIAVRDNKASQPKNRPIESFWIKPQGSGATKPELGKVLDAETKGYLLYGVSVSAVSGLFSAVWERVPLTVGVRLKGEPVDRIYVGVVQVSEQDADQVHQCLDELIKEMSRQVGGASEPKR